MGKGKVRFMMSQNKKGTIVFTHKLTEEELELKKLLAHVYGALEEKGLDPVQQIVGFLISDDPTYITSHKKARSLMQKADRYEVLSILLKNYLGL